MWTWVIRLGKYALSAWGLTEVATQVTDNIAEMGEDVDTAAGHATKAAKNIGVTIAIVVAAIVLLPFILQAAQPKRKR